MANASTTGFGLRAVMTVGNTPATSGQSEYKIQTAPGVATNKGDPMSFNDGGATAGEAGKVQDASFTVTDDGGTKFPQYDLITDAVVGRVVIWTTSWTHFHHGIVSKTQRKYIATGWYSFVE